jgi:hypothetical protein
VLLSAARSATTPSVLQWHRRDGQLELREQDRGRWDELPRQFREAWESNVRHHVRVFLGMRHSERVFCQMDCTPTPLLDQWRDPAGTGWLLSWCQWCKLGFLFTSSADYGWECCASVRWGYSDRLKCELFREYETGAGHAGDQQLLDGLLPYSPQPIGQVLLTDGTPRTVYRDRDGRHFAFDENGQLVFGTWTDPASDAQDAGLGKQDGGAEQHDVHHPQIGEELLIPAGAVHSARNIGKTTARWHYGYKKA